MMQMRQVGARNRLHIQVLEGHGPPLFMVHGILSDRTHWAPNVAALSTVCRPVLFELWGHGQSPVPEEKEEYTAQAYVEQFEAVRLMLNSPRIFLCGQSLGASLTLRYSLTYPQALIGQVFTNSMSAVGPAPDMSRLGAMADDLEKRGRPAVDMLPFHPKHARRMPASVRDALAAAADRVDPFGVAMTLRHTAPTLFVGDELPAMVTPTLLANGVHEKGFQPYKWHIIERVPCARVVDLPGGHAVNMEAPEEFNAAVVKFIVELTRPKPWRRSW